MATYISYTPTAAIAKAMFNFDVYGNANYRLTGTVRVSVSDDFSVTDYSNFQFYSGLYTSGSNEVAWTAQMTANLQDVLAIYSQFANITFQWMGDYDTFTSGSDQTPNPRDIGQFNLSDININWIYRADSGFAGISGANSDNLIFGYTGGAGDIFINQAAAKFAGNYTLDLNTRARQTLEHELGHSLGLSHPHTEYNSSTGVATISADYAATKDVGFNQLGFRTNSAADMYKEYFSIMSYDDQQSFLPGSTELLHAHTPMILDVIALQQAYGEGAGTSQTGNDTITAGTSGYRTYFDKGGTDTIDLSLFTGGAYLQMGVTITGASHLVGVAMSVSDRAAIVSGGDPSNLRWFYGEYENASGSSNIDWIYGNTLDNSIDGGAGADTLVGGLGNDTYIVDNIGDVVTENSNEGIDRVQSSVSYTLAANIENITLTGGASLDIAGNTLNNVLTGNSGNNVLDGGAGADTMAGGAGGETYVVDDSGDVVTENLGEGTDTVRSSVSYTLTANVENLYLLGFGNLSGTGNGLSNLLVGNLGADVLSGGAGDDVYVVQAAGGTVVENLNEGTDTVLSTVSFTLGANVENLTLLGSANINGTGNAQDNTLVSNTGVDVLAGGNGNDTYVVHNSADTIVETSTGGTDIVTSDVSFTLPTNVEHMFLLGFGNLNAMGNDLQNVLVGNLGADTLTGGLGDDIYFVQAPGSLIVESLNEGRDSVFVYNVSMTLSANVEDVYLQGAANVNATGNALDNLIYGNLGVNVLTGGLGDDVYLVQNAGTTVVENPGEGSDTVFSSVSFDLGANLEYLTLIGSANANGIGNAGNNTLAGNTGINVLTGGAGNDTYVIHNSASSVVENSGEGTDIVTSDVDFTLSANVEHMFLLGFGNVNATGNAVQNVLVGNLGINTLTGGQGNDIYFVQTAGATIVENPGEGLDTLFNYVSMALDANVEDMCMQGVANLSGTGNGGNNVITGNSGDNVINGKGGADTLIGGLGVDTFCFDAALNATTNLDTITDFTSGTDKIQLENAVFTALAATGSLNANFFHGGAGITTAVDANDYLIYNSTTGALYYDQDGNGSSASIQFATLSNHPLLTNADFVVTTVNVNTPVISSGATASFAENGAGTVYTATGTDADAGTTLSYALGGTDAAKFAINANTGAVTFVTAPNFEAPTDAGGNNVYDITVTANDGVNTSAAQAVAITVTNIGEAGEAVIDLGSYGKLIAPVQVDGGKWYYFWDRSGDGTSADLGSSVYADYFTHNELDAIFTQDINGAVGGGGDTTDTYRYATLNGVHLALPTVGGVGLVDQWGHTGMAAAQAVPTGVGLNVIGLSSNQPNDQYNDLLAVWDATNGTDDTPYVVGVGWSKGNVNGLPIGWANARYATASNPGGGFSDSYYHVDVALRQGPMAHGLSQWMGGYIDAHSDYGSNTNGAGYTTLYYVVALQVL